MTLSKIEESNLWKILETNIEKPSLHLENLSNVKRVTEYAADILNRTNETFPNYTWHNPKHALNVLSLMDEILGDFEETLTPSECTILLISAFMHDIGMAFTPEERELLFQHRDFSKFGDFEKYKKEKPEIHLKYRTAKRNGDDKVLREIALDYCRWKHAERVDLYLLIIEREGWLFWDGKPLRKSIRLVCESHNWDIKKLLSLDDNGDLRLNTTYWGSKADLLFCAILLRLADILDFDRTRAPKLLHRYLGLSPDNEPVSDMEWKKHMASSGFTFPSGEERKERYEITFVAHPEQPEIEYAIQRFLDVIERESEQCQKLIGKCSSKKQSFRLPDRIERQIESQNYKSGVYRFIVDEKRVIDLLMGENLYEDPYVFIRELVQNAIDTTRHRIAHEKIDPEAIPVMVSTWRDNDGSRWVRIDDNGVGMNESIIQNYLLRIGRSYYLSSEFQLDILDIKEKEDMNLTPISRFGIGILSCFIRGDRVEISTRREREQGLYLRLQGLDTFHVLYSEKEYHVPKKPALQGLAEAGYRNKPGTSIAVRLNPRYAHTDFDLGKMLENYVLFSKVPVEYKGQSIGGNYQDIIMNPWIDRIEVELNEEEMMEIETILHYKFFQPLKFIIQPLDLTQSSLRKKELAGQAVISYIEMADKDRQEIWNEKDIRRDIYISWSVSEDGNLQPPSLSLQYSNPRLRDSIKQQLEQLKSEEAIILQDAIKIDEQRDLFGFVHNLEHIIKFLCYYLTPNRLEKLDWLIPRIRRMQKRYAVDYVPTPNEIKEEVKELGGLWEKYERNNDFYRIIIQEFSDWLATIHPTLQTQFLVELKKDSEQREDWHQFDALLDQYSEKNNLRVSHRYQERFVQASQLFSNIIENFEQQELKKNEDKDTEARGNLTIDRIVTAIMSDRAKHILTNMYVRSHQRNGYWLSHNGIRIPIFSPQLEMTNNPKSPSIFEYNIQWLAVALFDSLRPKLNVARDKLVELPWTIYSNLLLAFARALQNTPIPHEHYRLDIFPFTGQRGLRDFNQNEQRQRGFVLEDFDQDEHMRSGEWSRQRVLLTNYGMRSAEDIRNLFSDGENVRLALWQNTIRHGVAQHTPLGTCRMAIIQKMLSVELDIKNVWLTVVSSEHPSYFSGLRLFPPFTFLPYSESILLKSGDLPFNMNHKFSEWFLENANSLNELYPALFSNLTTNLFATVKTNDKERYHDSLEPHEYIRSLQQVLDNIRDTIRDTATNISSPPYISHNDFYFEEL
jgi:hypothetical protein